MTRNFVTAAALVAAGILLGWALPDRPARAAGEWDGVVPLYAGGDVAFFDSATGDLWVHVPQASGKRNVERFRVQKRGAVLISAGIESQNPK